LAIAPEDNKMNHWERKKNVSHAEIRYALFCWHKM